MYVAIPKINDMNQSTVVMSINLFFLLQAAMFFGCRTHDPTNMIPSIIAIAPGMA